MPPPFSWNETAFMCIMNSHCCASRRHRTMAWSGILINTHVILAKDQATRSWLGNATVSLRPAHASGPLQRINVAQHYISCGSDPYRITSWLQKLVERSSVYAPRTPYARATWSRWSLFRANPPATGIAQSTSYSLCNANARLNQACSTPFKNPTTVKTNILYSI